MNSCEIVSLITALACQISQNKSQEELNILSCFFVQLGDTLATISNTKF